MFLEKRKVDLNAYIKDVIYEIKDNNQTKSISVSFVNLCYGTITAIKLIMFAKDSFGDDIIFGNIKQFEIKRADLNIKSGKKCSFSIEIGNYDIKKIDLVIDQIVYADGRIVKPLDENVVEYEVERLSSSWSQQEHFEKDALEVLNSYLEQAICFPKVLPLGWVCACGNLNSLESEICAVCGKKKDFIFEKCSADKIKKEVELMNERKDKEDQERKANAERERLVAEKKSKNITMAVVSCVVIAIAAIIIALIINNVKYGLSKEDAAKYELAQSNYHKIEFFIMCLGNEYSDVAIDYNDTTYSGKNRMSDAEKDKEYLYKRGIYEGSTLLYDLIKGQYPQKYQSTYEKLIKAQTGDVFNNIELTERLYVMNAHNNDSYFDKREAINEAIDELENYMDKTVFNPEKVEYSAPSMPSVDYSKVYGISLGIIFYDDGNIMYIGEIKNGLPHGYGEAFYHPDEHADTMANGNFEDGKFVSGDHYGLDGNMNDIADIQKFEFSGQCVMVSGLANSISSETVANKNKSDEEADKKKASACVEDYLQKVCDKENGTVSVEWFDIPTIIGSYYSYSGTFTMSDGSTRKGTIIVEKNSDGTFSPVRIDLD